MMREEHEIRRRLSKLLKEEGDPLSNIRKLGRISELKWVLNDG